MKKTKKYDKITFTCLPEKDEYAVKIGDKIYESEGKCFLEVEDELNDVRISVLPKDVIIHGVFLDSATLSDCYCKNKGKNSVEVIVTLSIHRKTWYENIGCEIFIDAFEKLLMKYLPLNVSNIEKEIDPDGCSFSFTLEFIAQHIVDVFNTVRELNDKINDEIFQAVKVSIDYFWNKLIEDNEHKTQ